MKHNKGLAFDMTPNPAAFRRLCVETGKVIAERWLGMPAAFRRLCVETMLKIWRICWMNTSRLQAAVC